MTFFDGFVRSHLELFRILKDRLGGGDVLGDIDQHRAGTARSRNVKRLLHHHRQVFHILDEEVVLDARPGNANGVTFLEGILTNRVGRHLSGNDHHRNGIHVRSHQTRHRIGDTGAGSH